MSAGEQEGCGAEHPHMDVACNFHLGDGRHRFIDEWGTLDSWPMLGAITTVTTLPISTEGSAPARGVVALVAVGTLLAVACGLTAFMLVVTTGSIS